ncbi:hybrid sensor histidine kinase/response regulator transcription factor [Viscerimonas tarda]
MHKIFAFIVFCSIGATNVAAQLSHYFEHYSIEEGLPQYTIMEIIQDHKGFMWFATWDGFSKFDGYRFKNYKVQSGDTYYMKSNRIENLCEDKYGNIWLKSYDGEAHCFDPHTETFKGIQSIPGYENYPFQLSQIKVQPSGKVWLLSLQNGCICITDSLFSAKVYNAPKGQLKGNSVHLVHEDKNSNSWILTDNGLCLVRSGQDETLPFFFDNKLGNENQSFFSAIEFDKEIWFGSNKGRIWKYIKSTGKFSLLETPTSSDITGFQAIQGGELVISTSNDGFLTYNQADDTFLKYNSANTKELKNNHVVLLYFDKLQQLWFETDELGIYKFDTQNKQITYFHAKVEDITPASITPPIPMVIEDIYGHIWVHPKGGGFSQYDKYNNSLLPFYNNQSSPDWRFSNVLHTAYSDKQGNLWLSTHTHGLEKVIFDVDYFKIIPINPHAKSPTANDVRAVLQDKDNNIWIATKNNYLSVYDEKYNLIGCFTSAGSISGEQPFLGPVYCMIQDNKGDIWLGTKGEGVFRIQKTTNPKQYQIEQFKKSTNDIYSISDNAIYSIFQDSKGNIWVGTFGNGLNLVKTDGEKKTVFINHRNLLKNYPIETGYRVRFISENKYGNISVGTTAGLIMFSSTFSMPDDIEYKYYTRSPSQKESLSSNDVHGICNTKNGDMFIATFGGGINKVTEYDPKGFPLKFKAYTVKDGLPSDVCLAILEDEKGKLWVSVENSLSKFDPETENFETFAGIKRQMSTSNFSEASVFRLSNNDLVFGLSNGILTFSPAKVKNNDFRPYIAFSDFRLFNQPVAIGKKDSPLERSIEDIDELVLKHNQNSFSIEYTALDFNFPDNILYAYKLEGFDNDWIYAQKRRIANYTNIPKGEYVFRVKSSNSEGIWVENERSLPVKVLPSFWETPWAIFLYIVLSLGLIFLSVHLLSIFYQLKNNVEIEKQLSEMKLRFFTDISHEIRTPLTMITAPVDYLLSEKDTPEKMKTQLNLVSQNTNRILRLVNQILDFRKMQHFQLKIQETDLGAFVESISKTFDEEVRKHRINFKFVNQAKAEKVWVDRDCIEKIVMNLLSNAFKYTPDEKTIEMTVKGNEKQLSIEVKDEGCGISKEKQKSLFTRFASFNEDKSKPSTGIGLFLVKDLLNKHGGKITVDSELGKGSLFVVSFPRGLNHFDDTTEIIAPDSQPEDKNELPEPVAETELTEQQETPEKKPKILVVEDDADLRTFIKTLLEQDYIVVEAEDGIAGLEKTKKTSPDFVVSDVMMPRMNGIELLQKLKEDITTSHIPVVLLTAKATIESKLEGLTYGADDYITKPFSVPYFRARINNLIEQRKRLQVIYRTQLTTSSNIEFEPQPFVITSQDEILMKKAIDIIEKNMDNSEFTVEELSSSVGMSRSVFFDKVKSLTGLAPLEFIRDIKLKRAAQLLASGEFMVKEASFMIGFSDTKYFGKCFKSKYGVTAHEYKNGIRQRV